MATKEQIEKTCENADKMQGKDPDLYRKDSYGNQMYRHSHGKSSEMGLDVDNVTPKSRGDSDAIRNLQALNSSVNRGKGDSLQKKIRHFS